MVQFGGTRFLAAMAVVLFFSSGAIWWYNAIVISESGHRQWCTTGCLIALLAAVSLVSDWQIIFRRYCERQSCSVGFRNLRHWCIHFSTLHHIKVLSRKFLVEFWLWIEIKFIDFNSSLALSFSCCWEVLQFFLFYLADQNDISDQIDWMTCGVSEMDLHLSLPVFPFSQSHLLSYFQSLFLPCWYVHNPQVYSSILPDIFRTCSIWRMQCC